MQIMAVPFSYDEAKLRETQAFRATQAFLRHVVGSQCMALLEGEPGVGKTFGALSFARRHNISYITMVPRVIAEKAPSSFVRTVASEITGQQYPSLRDAYAALELWAVNSGKPQSLFVDESQWMTGKILELLRSVHDRTGLTIVFIGHAGEFVRLLARYPQARDRVVFRFVVPPLSLDDLISLHPELPHEVINEVFAITQGNFRRVERILSLALGLAQAKRKHPSELSPAEIRSLTKYLAW